jgi:trehalose synthase-fused probable maltokinase
VSERTSQVTAGLEQLLDCETLRDWMVEQRWYASKSRAITAVEVVERVGLGEELHLVLVQARFATGTHEIYQLLLVAGPAGEAHGDGGEARGGEVIARGGELVAYDALADPRHALVLVARMLEDADVRTEQGCFAFRHVEGAHRPAADPPVRAMGVEQSNTSIVIDDRTVLKLFRKVESGINPELELLRFLTARGFDHIAPLHGWYEYEGSSLASTLGIAQEFIPDGLDGWELALAEIVSDPDHFLERVGSLGRITGQMHTTLASDASDPAFSPEDPSNEAMALLTASIDEDIERIFLRLPDTEGVEPILGRGEDVRAKLATRSQIGIGGKHIRIHGDYHLGQTLDTPRGWVILDFEGEPARPLPERRMKRSPLKDVAGMLRSFAYATSAVALQRGEQAPDGFEERARETFLAGYLGEVDPALLPAGEAQIANLLAIFELEKAVYELRYEVNHRPDWVAIPVAGIRRLLEES